MAANVVVLVLGGHHNSIATYLRGGIYPHIKFERDLSNTFLIRALTSPGSTGGDTKTIILITVHFFGDIMMVYPSDKTRCSFGDIMMVYPSDKTRCSFGDIMMVYPSDKTRCSFGDIMMVYPSDKTRCSFGDIMMVYPSDKTRCSFGDIMMVYPSDKTSMFVR